MKTLSTITVIILFLAACKSNIEPFEQKAKLKANEQVLLSPTTTWLKITKVQNNLCPPWLTCIWQGNAFIIFQLVTEGSQSEEKSICIGGCDNLVDPRPTTTKITSITNFNGKEYTVTVDSIATDKAIFTTNPLVYLSLKVK